MPLKLFAHKLLIVDGDLAMHDDCCCPGCIDCADRINAANITLTAPDNDAPDNEFDPCDGIDYFCNCDDFADTYNVPNFAANACSGTETFVEQADSCPEVGMTGCGERTKFNITLSWGISTVTSSPTSITKRVTITSSTSPPLGGLDTVGGFTFTEDYVFDRPPNEPNCVDMNDSHVVTAGETQDTQDCVWEGITVSWEFLRQ